jgi:hypothetical protein
MNYLELNDFLREYFKGHPLVAECYPIVSGGELAGNTTYPYISYNISEVTVGTDVTTVGIALLYADRQTSGTDVLNILEAQATGIRVLTELLNGLTGRRVRRGFSVEMPYVFTVFKDRFADECAGVTTDVLLSYPSEIGRCVYECP